MNSRRRFLRGVAGLLFFAALSLLLPFKSQAQILHGILGGSAVVSSGPVTLNTFGTTGVTAGTTASPSYSVAAGSGTVAFAIVMSYPSGSNDPAAPTVTFDGAAMTNVGTSATQTSGHYRADIYYLVGPSTGSKTLSITGTADTGGFYYNMIAFDNVNAATPVRAGSILAWPANHADLTSSPQDFIIPSTVSGDMVITGGMDANGVTSTSAGVGQYSANNGGAKSGITDYQAASGSSLTDTYTWNAATVGVFLGLAVRP